MTPHEKFLDLALSALIRKLPEGSHATIIINVPKHETHVDEQGVERRHSGTDFATTLAPDDFQLIMTKLSVETENGAVN